MFSIPVSLIFRHLDGYVPDELFPISPNSNNNNNNIGSMSGILNFLSLEEDDIFQIFSLVALEGISIYYYYSNEIVAGIFLYPTKSTWHSKRILLQRSRKLVLFVAIFSTEDSVARICRRARRYICAFKYLTGDRF